MVCCCGFTPMSAEQLSAFFAAVNADTGLQAKLKGASDLDAAVAIAQVTGFEVSKADWLRYQVKETLEHQEVETLELTDADLEEVAGGTLPSDRILMGRAPARCRY